MQDILLNLIRPAKDPIRQTRDEEKIKELAQSIAEKGVLQPIKIRPVPNDGTTEYEIVFGGRRFEAGLTLGLETIPAIIENLDNGEAVAEGLLENIQREDMLDIDIAKGGEKYVYIITNIKTCDYVNDVTWPLSVREALKKLASLLGISYSHLRSYYMTMITDKYKPIVDTFYQADPTVKDVKTKSKWIQESMPDESIEMQKAVVKKVVDEELGQDRARKIAKSVASAPTPEAKEKLLEWEFNSTLHDPEIIKERSKRLGIHDPLYLDETPSPEEEWEKTPEVKVMIDNLVETIKLFTMSIKEIGKTTKIEGKLSFEAKQFAASRLRKFRDEINTLLIQLEGEE